jgi:O-antigen ligase
MLKSFNYPNLGKSIGAIFVGLLAVAIAGASTHTKIAGAAWLIIVVSGAVCVCTRRRLQPGDFVHPTLTHCPVVSAAIIWLVFVTLALALKSLAVLYWDSGWEERHAEIRLFLGAIGSFGLAGCAVNRRSQAALIVGLCGACLTVFMLLFLYGANGAPTNRIPWMSGVALLILASLGAAFNFGTLPRVLLVFSSGLAAFGVIALGETRGAYPVGLIWIIALLSMLMISGRNASGSQRAVWKMKTKLWRALGSVSLVVLLLWSSQASLENTRTRVEEATAEFAMYMKGEDAAVNNSVGARLHMWELSIPVIRNNLLWGIGKDGRLAQINLWGKQIKSSAIKDLGHLHNEYLQTLLESGIFGLGSFLSYAAGMLWSAKRLWQGNLKVSATALVSINAMHSLAELTNMNFAHNYYPTLLSVSVAITLLFAQIEAQKHGTLAKTI